MYVFIISCLDTVSTWTAGENVQISKLALACTGTSFNKAFNIKTGEWLSYYVFKRLRFMNNIYLSQAITMIFVASWHGLASGYFVSFGIQGLNLTFERYFFAQLEGSLLVKALTHKLKSSTVTHICYQIFKWGHKLLYTPVILLGMHTFTFDRYWPIMKSVGVHWILLSYIILPISLNVLEDLYKSRQQSPDKNRSVMNGEAHKIE